MKIHYSPGGDYAGSITPRRFEIPTGERRFAASALRAAERAADQRIQARFQFYRQPFHTNSMYGALAESIERDQKMVAALTIVAAELEAPTLNSLPEVYEEGESINLRYVYRGMLEGFCHLADGAADREATLDTLFNTIEYEALPVDHPMRYFP